MTQQLTDAERAFIARVADRLGGKEGSQLSLDLEIASARRIATTRIMFDIPGYVRPVYEGQRSFGVEGRLRDADGTEMTACLYADENGRLLELELIRWGDGETIQPDWSAVDIY
jgi:hypothetical protein